MQHDAIKTILDFMRRVILLAAIWFGSIVLFGSIHFMGRGLVTLIHEMTLSQADMLALADQFCEEPNHIDHVENDYRCILPDGRFYTVGWQLGNEFKARLPPIFIGCCIAPILLLCASVFIRFGMRRRKLAETIPSS